MEHDRCASENGDMTDFTTSSRPPSSTTQRKFCRSTNNRVVAGVAGGLAEHLDIDVTAVRVGFVAASLLLGGLGGPVLYALAWAVVPESGKETSVISDALRGKPWQQWGTTQQA
jgi:phage shock protein PspC (stress-responsive transcriptional regulator)